MELNGKQRETGADSTPVFIALILLALASAPSLGSAVGASAFDADARKSSRDAVTVFGSPQASVDEATLFAFDDVSIPWKQNLYIQMQVAQKYAGNPVIENGRRGEPDSYRVQFYGSVIRHQGKFKLWYIAGGDEALEAIGRQSLYGWYPAYAESEDGIHWTKPKLGLVDYRGGRANNLLLLEPRIWGHHLIVIHDADDPDPSRRFKMMMLTKFGRKSTSIPLYSGDGLRWRVAVNATPVEYVIPEGELALPAEHFEQAGLYKWNGVYHLAGQQFSPDIWLSNGDPCGRVMSIFRSADFVHWSPSKALSFVRMGYKSAPEGHGEEVHEPASVWHRGNVLLGLYGIWHGAPEWGGRRMDLGLLISNDGVHFREPVPGFAVVPRGEPGSWDQGGLISGQAFENVGDRTYIWYGNWNLSLGPKRYSEMIGRVGLGTFRQDGFGCLVPKNPTQLAAFVTCPLRVQGSGKIRINAEGLSKDARLRVELVGEDERPLLGPTGAVLVQQSGVQTEVPWKGKMELGRLPGTLRIRVSFEGEKRQSIKFYALYVSSK